MEQGSGFARMPIMQLQSKNGIADIRQTPSSCWFVRGRLNTTGVPLPTAISWGTGDYLPVRCRSGLTDGQAPPSSSARFSRRQLSHAQQCPGPAS